MGDWHDIQLDKFGPLQVKQLLLQLVHTLELLKYPERQAFKHYNVVKIMKKLKLFWFFYKTN